MPLALIKGRGLGISKMARFGTRPRLASMFQGAPTTRRLGGESKIIRKTLPKTTTTEAQAGYSDQEWLQNLKQNEPELYQIYQEGGGEALNEALEERAAKQDSILSKLDKYKDGDAYDIATALKDEAVKGSDLTFVGFSQSDIDIAIETGQKMVRQETIVGKLDTYKGDEGYDIATALIDKAVTTAELKDAGFDDSAVDDAVRYAEGEPRRQEINTKLEPYKGDEGYSIVDALAKEAVTADDLVFMGFEQEAVDNAVKAKDVMVKLADYRSDVNKPILNKLERYKEDRGGKEQYYLDQALRTKHVTAEELLALGFDESVVAEAVEQAKIPLKAEAEAVWSELTDYKENPSYNITKALMDGKADADDLQILGFSDEAIAQSIKYADSYSTLKSEGFINRDGSLDSMLSIVKRAGAERSLELLNGIGITTISYRQPGTGMGRPKSDIVVTLTVEEFTKYLDADAKYRAELQRLRDKNVTVSAKNKARLKVKYYPKWSEEALRASAYLASESYAQPLVWVPELGESVSVGNLADIMKDPAKVAEYGLEGYKPYFPTTDVAPATDKPQTGMDPQTLATAMALAASEDGVLSKGIIAQAVRSPEYKAAIAKADPTTGLVPGDVAEQAIQSVTPQVARTGLRDLIWPHGAVGAEESTPQIVNIEPEYQTTPGEGITIPMTQQELADLGRRNAEAACQADVCDVNTYKVSGRDQDGERVSIFVEAIDKRSAKAKAEDFGLDNISSVNFQTKPPADTQTPTGNYIVTFDDGTKATMVEFIDPKTKEKSLLPQDTAIQLMGMDEYLKAKGTPEQRLGIAYAVAQRDYEKFQAQVSSGKIKEVGQGEYIAKSDYDALPKPWQDYADQFGVTALGNRVDAYTDILKDYENEDGTYNVFTALTDPKDWQTSQQHQDAVAFLFGEDTLNESLDSCREQRITVTAPTQVPESKYDYVGKPWYMYLKEDLTPWREEEGQTAKDYFANIFLPSKPEGWDTWTAGEKREWTKRQQQKATKNALLTVIFPGFLALPSSVTGLNRDQTSFVREVGILTASIVGAPLIAKGIPQVAKFLWKAPARAITKVAVKIPRLMQIPILGKAIPQGAILLTRMATVGAPAYVLASKIGEAVQSADIQRKWNVFTSLPEKEKDKWAKECGYDKWEGLTETEQAAVLARYSVPESYSGQKWVNQLGQYTNKLVELAAKGPEWLQQHTSPGAALVGSAVIGAGIGLAEGVSYMAQMPMLFGNIAMRVPSGEAGKYATDVGKGMVDFFKSMPGIVASGPYGAGRMIGLFILSPETVLQLAGGGIARVKARYIPERGIGQEVMPHTLRVSFKEAMERFREYAKTVEGLSPKERMELGAKIEAVLLKGKAYEKRFGPLELEVSTTPYQKAVGNTLWHVTPDIRPFLDAYKTGRPIKIKGELYTSAQAATYVLQQSLVTGAKPVKPGIVGFVVPEGFTIKGAPITKLIEKGMTVEVESPLTGTAIPQKGWGSKATSANIYVGEYPIRMFAIEGVKAPFSGISPKQFAKIRMLAMKESLADFVLGWHGRVEAIKANLASGKRLQAALKGIDNSIKSLKKSPDSVVAKNGEIVSQIKFDHPAKGPIVEKTRGLVVSKDGQVLLLRDKADPAGVWDILGGGLPDKKLVINPATGKRLGDMAVGKQPTLDWKTAWRSQGMDEGLLNPTKTEYLGMYRGKVGEHSVYGVRTYLGRVSRPFFDRIGAWKKYQRTAADLKTRTAQPEIADVYWWDGKSEMKGEVQPWVYDMMAAIADKFKWDMSKVKVAKPTANYLRDINFANRVKEGKNIDLTSAERKQFEINALTGTYDKMSLPGFRDYITKGGAQLDLISELIKGRRRAVKWSLNEPAKATEEVIRNSKKAETATKAPEYRPERAEPAPQPPKMPKPPDTSYVEDYLTRYKQGKVSLAQLRAKLTKALNEQDEYINSLLERDDVKPYLERDILDQYYANYLDRAVRDNIDRAKADRRPVWERVAHYDKPFPYTGEYQGAFTYDVSPVRDTPYRGEPAYKPVSRITPTKRVTPTKYKIPDTTKTTKITLTETRKLPEPERVRTFKTIERQKLTSRTQRIELGQKFPKREGPALAVWRQGAYWVSIFPPFRTTGTKADVVYSREKPPWGSVIVKGKRSPRKTLRSMGKIPKLIELPMGIVTARIQNGRTLTFSRRNGRKRGRIIE